ncbi:MAG: VWA domain-containing protein [Deltaproteobacteria bacterium]|nr:VWA domain-containing protein [Deltaproteobacteria bacterium]
MRRRSAGPVGLLALVGLPVAGYLVWDLANAGQVAFKYPLVLLGLLALPLLYLAEFVWKSRGRAALAYSSTAALSRLRQGFFARLVALPQVLRLVAVALLVVACARPQTRDRGGRVEVQGIDIVVALDLSKSMEATDLVPNRLEAAKKVLDDFILRRRGDRMGLVIFGREAFTHCPLTLDYGVLRELLGDLHFDLIDGSATAIGNALGVGLARLRASDAKSKVIILLTDGDSNAGNVAPSQAARYAQAMKVKVFTILMGAQGEQVVRDAFGRAVQGGRQFPVNPKLLEEIAAQTGGKAYLATDRQGLEEKFEQILRELDKSTRREVAAVYADAHRPFAATGLGLLLLEALLVLTRLRRFP